MQELRVKLSEELVEQIEELARKRNISKADIVREAIMYYIGISETIAKQIESSDSKIVTALYSGKCRKCGKEISQGDVIGLIRIKFEGEEKPKSFTYCLDCYYSITDKTIVQLEIKRVKLQKTVSALKREINKLVNIYEELEREVKTMSNLKQVLEELKLYLEKVYQGENVDLKKLIQELSDLNMNISDLLRVVEVKKKIYSRYKIPHQSR